ncbi:MAG TPA: DUF4382 domain-containing protein [Fimbriimonas sp.]
MSKGILFALSAALVGVFAAGCGGNDDNGGSNGDGRGTLAVRLADAPDPTISELNITIGGVQANVDDRWVDVENDDVTLDLLDLVENDTSIGSTELPVGTYNQIRLFVTDATVTDSTGTHDVEIPSADQTGVKVIIPGGYRISNREITTLLLDFDVDKSLTKTGNGRYILRPTIKGVVKVLSGTVTGVVTDSAGAPLDNARVTAYLSSDLVNPVHSTSTLDDGRFKLWALMPGEYTLVIEWDDPEDVDLDPDQDLTVAEVDVIANENTALGTIQLEATP